MNKLIEKFGFGNQQRLIENIVIFIILLVILMIVINGFGTVEEKSETIPTAIINENKKTDDLEEKLEKILGMIDGVRKGKCNDIVRFYNHRSPTL